MGRFSVIFYLFCWYSSADENDEDVPLFDKRRAPNKRRFYKVKF